VARKKTSRIKKRRHFTLMYVPHTQKSLSRFKVPIWTVYFLIFLMLAFTGTLAYYANDYIKTLKELERLENVDAINKVQSEKIEKLLEKTQAMEQKMKKLNELDLQVRKMVGLEPENEEKKNLDDEAYLNEEYQYERDKFVTLALNDSETLSRGGGSRDFRFDTYNGLQILDSIDKQLSELHSEANNEKEKLTELKKNVEERLKFLAAKPNRWPVRGSITSNFGYRKNPFGGRSREFHDGLDIAAPYGTPVRAAGDGKVIFAGYRYGYGLMVSISHGYGYISHYGHNSRITVRVGERVKKGEIIARIGSTGRSTGPHVHFMIDKNGRRINPLKVLE